MQAKLTKRYYKIIFTLLLGLSYETKSMLFPLFSYLDERPIVIVQDSESEKLTRKWLNWVYAQNSSVTSITQVQTNINYYHEMIKNHYNYLTWKKENGKLIKKLKTKAAVISSAITIGLWSGTYYLFHKFMELPWYENNMGHGIIISSSTIFGFMSFILSCKFINSLQKFDKVLNRSLKRDEHMLQQFEEYKAACQTQNTHF